LILHWAGRTSKVIDLIALDMPRIADIVSHELELRMINHSMEIRPLGSGQIIQTHDVVPVLDESVTEVRSYESSPSGH